jgi:hypothetical protein
MEEIQFASPCTQATFRFVSNSKSWFGVPMPPSARLTANAEDVAEMRSGGG